MTLPRRRKSPSMKVRERPQVRLPAHLKWIRGHECAIAGKHDCEGRIEAAHVRGGTDGGLGVKPSDWWTIPLCSAAHAEQHRTGEAAFQMRYKLNMKATARGLWLRSPVRMKWERR